MPLIRYWHVRIIQVSAVPLKIWQHEILGILANGGRTTFDFIVYGQGPANQEILN